VAVVRHALELQSPLETTWAIVANTDRSDAAAGLPRIDYTDSPVGDGTSRRTFSYRLKGLAVEGEEQPLRWEFPRFYEVRRTYSRGPFRRTFHRCEPRAVEPGAGALAVYNVLRAVGSLQGLEYWSASRGRMRLLYEYSSLVAGPDDRTSLGDTRLPALPVNAETLFARQKDLSFGDNVYKITLSTGQGYTAQHSTNLTGMRYGIVPVAAPGVVNVRLLVIDVDEGLIFYTVSSAKAAVLPGVRAKLESSFGNRAEAVYAWFSRELAKTWPAR